jgi:hypothetical protein
MPGQTAFWANPFRETHDGRVDSKLVMLKCMLPILRIRSPIYRQALAWIHDPMHGYAGLADGSSIDNAFSFVKEAQVIEKSCLVKYGNFIEEKNMCNFGNFSSYREGSGARAKKSEMALRNLDVT